MFRVFVTDASERAALAVIRSLGRREIEVTAGHSTSFNAGFLSKYCKHKALYVSPQKNRTGFVRSLLKLVKKGNFDLLIPITDFTAMPLSQHKEEFEPYVAVAVPPYDIAGKVFDKAQTIQIASKCDIPHPQTFFIEDVDDVAKVASEINYPIVIKPRMKVMWVNDSAVVLKVSSRNYAYGPKDLVTKYHRMVSQHRELTKTRVLPMIQEYVLGTGYGVEVLMDRSEPKAVFMHKRLREYPITGGASTLRESVRNDEVIDLGIRILKGLDWHGVAMVEFRGDEGLREPKLMEVNGRFWGSLPLAISSGVDFPYLLCMMMLNEDVGHHFNYRVGVKQRWLFPGDLLWLLSSLRSRPNRLRALKGFVASFRVPDDTFSLDDPLPMFGDFGAIVEALKTGSSLRYPA